MNATPSSAPSTSARIPQHTSIIYFHGMGTPRRYEEVSRILDSMDRYASADSVGKVGILRGQKVGLEPRRNAPADPPVTFFKFARFIPRPGKRAELVGAYRLYENFWSPAAAGGLSAFGVLLWLLLRTLHPFKVVSMPWRAHQRLKRTILNRLFYDRGARPVALYRDLGRAYRDFEGMDARREYPRGRFGDFLKYLAARHPRDARHLQTLRTIAFEWRRELIRSQLGVILLACTMYAALAGLAIGFVFLAAALGAGIGMRAPAILKLVERAGPISPLLVAETAIILTIIGIGTARFLERYLSDVVFWTTTYEKDLRYQKRQEILRAAEDMVLHVLGDPSCERIVILAHSLGTAIAHETLLNLGKRLKAERDSGAVQPGRYDALRKISHVISLGSPIDRISYFFNLTFSRYHRFNRVADELMGQTSDLPYKEGREPIIQWINIRDRSDPIASRLFSPRGTLPNRDEIQEVEVASAHFPNPGAAHTGYFESWLASKVIYDMAVLGRTTLQLGSKRPTWSYRAAGILRVLTWACAVMFAWAIGVGGLGYAIASPGLMAGTHIWAIVLLATVGLSWLVGMMLDRRHRLTLPS